MLSYLYLTTFILPFNCNLYRQGMAANQFISRPSVQTHFLISLTLGAHAQEGYTSWVCLSVCLSIKSHLTSGASVRPENTVVYSAGNGGKKIVGFSLKPLSSRVMA